MMKNIYILLVAALSMLLLLLLFQTGILDRLALMIGLYALIAIIVGSVILISLILIAIPYYLYKKKPETEEYGNYRLEDFKE